MSIDFSDNGGFETEEPLVTTSLTRDDEGEGSLRPKSLGEYIGQHHPAHGAAQCLFIILRPFLGAGGIVPRDEKAPFSAEKDDAQDYK